MLNLRRVFFILLALFSLWILYLVLQPKPLVPRHVIVELGTVYRNIACHQDSDQCSRTDNSPPITIIPWLLFYTKREVDVPGEGFGCPVVKSLFLPGQKNLVAVDQGGCRMRWNAELP
jgi:hypothetical protein